MVGFFPLSDALVSSLTKQVAPLNCNGPNSVGKDGARRSAGTIERLYSLKRHLIEYVAFYSFKPVKVCAGDLLSFIYAGESTDIENEIEWLRTVSSQLIRRLCRIAREMRIESRQQKTLTGVSAAIDDSTKKSQRENIPQQVPCLVSLLNRMRDNNLVAHEFVI
ncbi:hypothetical protein TraAM80_01653 [Trypanosoma rangeli]|uniref:Uncharacterized protein n=1 Tax=Trypanosoma rangeli TaxID=5698 RepID=A0A422NXT3_TRYRA|nr:uncharacterized protein TraAM80_01653 [Trypanosoma rangeli]RNF10214.1 hypothetical protein TraAM80_01653 [Trypanosoma rangeli]|eukprot:RNF10214.1 hypothetical protein TraAM80_01653 [Trypanosoma rangeli]